MRKVRVFGHLVSYTCLSLLIACSSGSGSGGSGGGTRPTVQPEQGQAVVVRPHEDFAWVEWNLDSNIQTIQIQVRQNGETTTYDINNPTQNFFRVPNLTDNTSYQFRITLTYADGSRIQWQSNSVTTGPNLDNDSLRDQDDPDEDGDGIVNDDDLDRRDPTENTDTDGDRIGNNKDTDDDNDGLPDDDVRELLQNQQGISCSLLPDCDHDGTPDTLDLDVDGDKLIEIETQQQLDQMRFALDGAGRRASATGPLNTTGCENGCQGYELLNDIALALDDPAGWRPIGNINERRNVLDPMQIIDETNIGSNDLVYCAGEAFSGTFDGNGRTISNLRINRPDQDCIGLFAKANNEIRNLRIQATEIKGRNAVGTLVGDGGGAKIVSAHSQTRMVAGFGNASIGGLIGTMHRGSISYSSAQTDSLSHQQFRLGGLIGDISISDISHSASLFTNFTAGIDPLAPNIYSGGLVGMSYNSTIRNSFSIGEKIEIGTGSAEDQMVAGLVGIAGGWIINSSAVIGTISARANVGGLIGQDGANPTEDGDVLHIIANSFALTEHIRGRDSIGGLGGHMGDTGSVLKSYAITGSITASSSGIGGFMGEYNDPNPIKHSYSIVGTLKGSEQIGGFIGEYQSGLIISSYAIAHTLEGTDLGGLTGFDRHHGEITASYAMAAQLKGGKDLGGLIGQNQHPVLTEEFRESLRPTEILASYAVTDEISGENDLGGLIGEDLDSGDTIIRSSYWDNLATQNVSMRNITTLQSAALAAEWQNETEVGDSAIWCDENNNAVIEENEKRDDNRIWDFGADNQYPVISCVPDNVLGIKQERWRTLNATGKLNLPDSAELTRLIRDYRNQQRAAFNQRTRSPTVLLRPHENYILLEWLMQDNAEVETITIEARHRDQTTATYIISNPATPAFRVPNLSDGINYNFRITITYKDGDTHSINTDDTTTGLNTDSDTLLNKDDPDDDNDQLNDDHPIEQMQNGSGISCSLLPDCDGDRLKDSHPTERLQNRNGVSCASLTDCDGDSLLDNHPAELLLNQNNISCAIQPDCDSDTLSDNQPTELLFNQNHIACATLADCDGDNLKDNHPTELMRNGNGTSCAILTDCDGDGTHDNRDAFPIDPTEISDNDDDRIGDNRDPDDDNDNLLDNHSLEQLLNQDSIACALLTDCDGDRLLDNHTSEQMQNGGGTFCAILTDCDGDRLLDNHTSEQMQNERGMFCAILTDCDGDRLLDNHTLEQLLNQNDRACATLTDCDGDRLLDNHTSEQMQNERGIFCAILTDCDGDSANDDLDAFPTDPTETTDTDGDRIGNNADTDDDNDNLLDNHSLEQLLNQDSIACALLPDCDGDRLLDNHSLEQLLNQDSIACALLPDCDGDSLLDNQSTELMRNGNGTSCAILTDCDGDGTHDNRDAFPIDPTEISDNDGDRIGDNRDPDDDNDNLLDNHSLEQLLNQDSIACALLTDCDGDRLLDNHTSEQMQNERGMFCAILTDCDGDRLLDNHTSEQMQNERGMFCAILTDCDGDRLLDNHTLEQLLNQNDRACATLTDCDGDRLLDNHTSEQMQNERGMFCAILTDCDGDGANDDLDAFPLDPTETTDTDGDRIGNNRDPDDDNDNLLDSHSTEQMLNQDSIACALLPDCDGDRLLDNHTLEQLLNQDSIACALLPDCDGDRLLDNHTLEQLQNGGGIFCAILTDCDSDTLLDNHTSEQMQNRNGIFCAILPDCDGDGANDNLDAFPIDPTETTDTDGDRIGNNRDPDDDNDNLLDNHTTERLLNQGNIACALLTDCDGDTLNDNHPIEQLLNLNNLSCAIQQDCDGDTLNDNHPIEQLLNSNNLSCAIQQDCDGDTLLDNHTFEQLLNQNDRACAILPDCDGDGTLDNLDAFPIDPTETTDTDGDRIGNNRDPDDDNDNLPDDNSKELLFNQGGVACSLLPDCDNDGTLDNDDLDSDNDQLIEIQTQQELSQIRYALNGTGRKTAADQPINTNGCHSCRGYELINNISLSLSDPAGWQPIGENQCSANLTAVFEGNHFTITGLSINQPEQNCVGLFAAANNEIRNLFLYTNQIHGHNFTAALVGYAANARIHNVQTSAVRIQGQHAVGGLVGKTSQTNISQSAAITSRINGQQNIGGLIGQADDTSAKNNVLNSYAITAEISGHNSGGIAGTMNGQIIASYAIAHSIESPSQAGGLIGLTTAPTHILSSYAATSSASATTSFGGLVGLSQNTTSITTSYALANMSSAANLGGLIGLNQTTANNQSSYWDGSLNSVLAGPGSAQPTSFLQANIADWNNDVIAPDNAVWCDTNHNFVIENSEKTNANFIWNFGENNQYPVISCAPTNPLGLGQARWRVLNGDNRPNLPDTTELNSLIEGLLTP